MQRTFKSLAIIVFGCSNK